MEDFKNILYPIALTDISPKVATYVVTMAKQLDAQVHLLHVLRRFDWFVDTYVVDPPEPGLKELGEMMIQNFSNNFRNTTSNGIQSWQILN